MSDAGAPPRVAAAPLSHTASEQWQSFEMRMRHRRAERCRMRAQMAMRTGCVEEARAALAEARALEPDAPENTFVERLIAAGPPKAAIATGYVEKATAALAEARALEAAPSEYAAAERPTATSPPKQEHPITVPAAADRRLPVTLAAVATVAIAAAAWIFWHGGPGVYIRSGGITAADQRAGTNAAEVQPVSTLTVARTVAAANPPSVTDPMTHLDEAQPGRITEPISTTGTTAAVPGQGSPSASESSAPAEFARAPIAQPEPVAMPPSPSGAPASPERDMPARNTSASDAGIPAASPLPDAANAPRPSDPAERAEAPRTIPGNVVEVSQPPADETASIRAVLSRYAAAYSELDAAAAGAVWPDVDRRALTRAFETLESQHVSLGGCDVTVNGAAAHARCSGTTQWTPKVGGGVHSAARIWTFDLAKQNDAWVISSATVR